MPRRRIWPVGYWSWARRRWSSPVVTAESWSTSSSTVSVWWRSTASVTPLAPPTVPAAPTPPPWPHSWPTGRIRSTPRARRARWPLRPLPAVCARSATERGRSMPWGSAAERWTSHPRRAFPFTRNRASRFPRHELERRRRDQASPPAFLGRLRRSRPRPLARLHEGHRLRRRRAQQADGGDRQHLDRGDALQLPPPGAGRARQRGG